MDKLIWYKRYPTAALEGMMELSLEERGAYNTVLDLIYDRAGELTDDDRFLCGWMRCDLRVWRRIKTRLIDLKKIYIIEGKIKNSKADAVILRALGRVLSAREAGLASAAKRAAQSKEIKEMTSTTVERPFQLDRRQKIEEDTKEVSSTPLPPKGVILPDWINLDDWKDFSEMRKRIKKPMTNRAAMAIIKKLETFMNEGYSPEIILENSIRNSWQDVYAPKNDYQNKPEKKSHGLKMMEAAARAVKNSERTE